MTASSVSTNRNARILTRGYNDAGHALFCRLLREHGNIALSPLSIGAAMTVAQAGARGETEREIARLFSLDLSASERELAYAALLGFISQYNTDPAAPEEDAPIVEVGDDYSASSIRVRRNVPPETKITVTNALATAQPGLVSGQYIATLAGSYGTELLEVETADQINAWICNHTNGLIKRIVERFEPETAAVIINALYFKANWLLRFERDLSCDGDFQLAGGETVKTPMMNNPGIDLKSATGEGYRAIRIPYIEWRLGLIVVVPDQGQDIVSVAEHLGADELARLTKDMAQSGSTYFNLTMPKFKARSGLSLGEHLKELGVQAAFDEQRADFSGLAAEPDLPFWIGDVRHCAVVDVNEDGTEAAAGTMVMLAGAGYFERPEPEPFKVDRPFLFYITDEITGIVLFQGKVVDPRLL